MTEHQPMPVRGYNPQSDEKLALVNKGKAIEAEYIAYLKELADHPLTDKRMVAIAKTQVQGGCMWAYRSVFQPAED